MYRIVLFSQVYLHLLLHFSINFATSIFKNLTVSAFPCGEFSKLFVMLESRCRDAVPSRSVHTLE
jgi:hypothetical protein